jgi:hypothetical protein
MQYGTVASRTEHADYPSIVIVKNLYGPETSYLHTRRRPDSAGLRINHAPSGGTGPCAFIPVRKSLALDESEISNHLFKKLVSVRAHGRKDPRHVIQGPQHRRQQVKGD